jgi:hypothetical protein
MAAVSRRRESDLSFSMHVSFARVGCVLGTYTLGPGFDQGGLKFFYFFEKIG